MLDIQVIFWDNGQHWRIYMDNVISIDQFKQKEDKQKDRLIQELAEIGRQLSKIEKESFELAVKAQEYLNEAMAITFHLHQHELNDEYLRYVYPQLEFDF